METLKIALGQTQMMKTAVLVMPLVLQMISVQGQTSVIQRDVLLVKRNAAGMIEHLLSHNQ